LKKKNKRSTRSEDVGTEKVVSSSTTNLQLNSKQNDDDKNEDEDDAAGEAELREAILRVCQCVTSVFASSRLSSLAHLLLLLLFRLFP
jgi:hypothetical protein